MMGQEDPQEVQREIEALQRVVARTSEYVALSKEPWIRAISTNSDNSAMVDVYDIVPQDKAPQPAANAYLYSGQDPIAVRYQTLLSKLASQEDLAAVARVDWGSSDDDTIEMQQGAPPIQVKGVDNLVGDFTAAAAAMSWVWRLSTGSPAKEDATVCRLGPARSVRSGWQILKIGDGWRDSALRTVSTSSSDTYEHSADDNRELRL
jgi:hypothetical protein